MFRRKIIIIIVEIVSQATNVIKLKLRNHPDVLFCYSSNYVEVILRAENSGKNPLWVEADISCPEKLSLSPNSELRKGRVRVGIVGKKEYLEKAVRIYADKYTNPQMYRCDVTLFVFNHDGIIDSRMEKSIDLRCEQKKEASL